VVVTGAWQWLAVMGAAAVLAAPMPVSAYEEGNVADGGTLQGRVTYAGAVPTKKIIPT
jgi:hypothetical protein